MSKHTRKFMQRKRSTRRYKVSKQMGGGANDDLWNAAKEGNPDKVKEALDNGANINCYVGVAGLYRNNTSLFIACKEAFSSFPQSKSNEVYKKFLEIIETLLDKGADPNIPNYVGDSILHELTHPTREYNELRAVEIMEILLKNGANPNIKNKMSITPLIRAVIGENVTKVKMLMEYEADPTIKSAGGDDAFTQAKHISNSQKRIKILEILNTVKPADPNKLDAKGYAPLHKLSLSFSSESEESLIEKAKTLLEKGANLELPGGENAETPVISAILNKKPKLTTFFLDVGANPNVKDKNGSTLLQLAAQTGSLELVQKFYEMGQDIHYANKNGSTVLHFACSNNHLHIVQYLISNGANVNAEASAGITALGLSIVYRNKDIAHYLLEHGADPNKGVIDVIDKNSQIKQPPILYLIQDGSFLDLLPIFLEKGQDPNVLGQFTSTISTRPLHLAIHVYNRNKNPSLQKKLLESMKLLIAFGADLKLKDSNGQTPADLVQDEETEKALGIMKLWEGFTRTDVAFLNSIFTKEMREYKGIDTPKANDYSLCPVCLKTVERPEGCMHMQHNCKEQPGFYHTKLYEKYKSDDKIHWCTICNRIGSGKGTQFQHYTLGMAEGPVPAIAGPSYLFDIDCSERSGGGGLPEKYKRFNTLRNVALEYNHPSFIDNESFRKVMEELVEAMWNLGKKPLAEQKLAQGVWNRPNTNFLSPKISKNSNNTNIPTPNSVQDPIIHPVETAEWQNSTLVDDKDIIQFLHHGHPHDKSGQQISRIGFAQLIEVSLGNPTSESFGHCWQYIPIKERTTATPDELQNHCDAVLWPREVRIALGLTETPEEGENVYYRKLYNGYKLQFNRKYKGTQ